LATTQDHKTHTCSGGLRGVRWVHDLLHRLRRPPDEFRPGHRYFGHSPDSKAPGASTCATSSVFWYSRASVTCQTAWRASWRISGLMGCENHAASSNLSSFPHTSDPRRSELGAWSPPITPESPIPTPHSPASGLTILPYHLLHHFTGFPTDITSPARVNF